MLNTSLEKRKSRFEDSVVRVAEVILREKTGGYFTARTFGIHESLVTPEMSLYFRAFLKLVIEKNTADYLKKKHKRDVKEGRETETVQDLYDSSRPTRRKFYSFDFGSGFHHDSLHALIGLARSSDKRSMQSLSPAYELRKPYADEILSMIMNFPTPQRALHVRDEVLVSEFQDGTTLNCVGANGASPGLESSGPEATRKYIIERIKDFYGDGNGPWANLVAKATASSPDGDPVFYRIMSEIADNNGADPYILYRIFMREAGEFLNTFAPDVPVPVLPVPPRVV